MALVLDHLCRRMTGLSDARQKGIRFERHGSWMRASLPPAESTTDMDAVQILALNDIAGGLRVHLDGRVAMVADVPISEAGFEKRTAPWLLACIHSSSDAADQDIPSVSYDPMTALVTAGWNCKQADSSIEITLSHQPVCYTETDSAWCMEMPLDVDWHDLKPRQSEAVAAYLLRACQNLKMVKPVLRSLNEFVKPFITVTGSLNVFNDWALRHTRLALLTASATLSDQIYHLLRDPKVAELYLNYQNCQNDHNHQEE